MGKTITKPPGYTVNNSTNLGTLTLVSGTTYTGTDITISAVTSKIDGGSYALSVLNRHVNLNKWAAFKPHIAHAVHGWQLYGTLQPWYWQYVPPTEYGPFRLGDWIGYNHNATSTAWDGPSPEPDTNLTYDASLDLWIWTTSESNIPDGGVEPDGTPMAPDPGFEEDNEYSGIEILITLPEWDITEELQHVDGSTYTLSKIWLVTYLDSSLCLSSRDVSTAELTNRSCKPSYRFTPQVDYNDEKFWCPDDDSGVGFSIQPCLGNNTTYHASWPLPTPEQVIGIGTLKWRYYYGFEDASISVCDTGVESTINGSVRIKVDRLGTQEKSYYQFYYDTGGAGGLLDTPTSGNTYKTKKGDTWDTGWRDYEQGMPVGAAGLCAP